MIYGLGLVALCFAWLLPGHFYPYTAFQQDLLSASGLALVVLGSLISVREWPTRMPLPAIVALLLALVPPLQWAVGLVPFLSDALLPAAYVVGFALAVIAGSQVARAKPEFAGALFIIFGAGAIISVGLGLAQWLELGPYPFLEYAARGERMYANLTQANQLASLLGLGIASVLWGYETRRIGGPVAALAMAYLGFGLMMTQSRAGWLMVFVFVVLWALYRRRLALRTSPWAVLAAVLLFTVAVYERSSLDAWVHLDGTEAAAAQVRTLDDDFRRIHWQTLWDALSRKPWLGYGWMQIAVAQQAAVLDHPPTFELLSAAHNQLLDFLIWNGVPLGMLLIGAMAWWAVDRMRRCATLDAWALFAALGVLFAHSMVELPLQYAYFLMPAGLMVGVIEARTPSVRSLKWSVPVGRAAFAVAALAMVGLLYVLWDEYYKVEEAVRRVRLKQETRLVQQGAEPAVPEVVLLDGQREYVRLWLTEPRERMSESQLDWLRMVSRRYPSPGALMRYAVAAGLNGRNEDALRSLQIMCRIAVQRHCDSGRRIWAAQAQWHLQLRAIPYPETPKRL
jgi:O-antigen ligase